MKDLLLKKTKDGKKIAIMHDYFRVLGGAEKLVISLAQHLNAPIITSEATESLIQYAKEKNVALIVMGKLTQFPFLLPPVTSKRFSQCDFSKEFSLFIFSGSFSIYAAKKHKPNIWYCHTPLKGLYEDETMLETKDYHEKDSRKNIDNGAVIKKAGSELDVSPVDSFSQKALSVGEGVNVISNKNKSLYAEIVNFKKRYIPFRIVPKTLSNVIDPVMNTLHNSFIQAKDITRDSLIQARDISRDSLIQAKDITRDSLIQAKDVTRDSLIQAREIQHSYIKPFQRYVLGYMGMLSFIKTSLSFLYLCFSLRHFNITKKRDSEAINNFDKIVCNSLHTKKKCDKIYGKDSLVVYPPIDSAFYAQEGVTEIKTVPRYWLSINRLVPHKRVELQLEAFKDLSFENLIIAGGFDNQSEDYASSLFGRSQKNVTFAGFVTDEKVNNLIRNCKGFITTAKDEDFGMTVVEAMAAGKPVIAPAEGGYLESVTFPQTGMLVADIDANKLKMAIETLSKELGDNPSKYREACIRQAKKFSDKVFFDTMELIIKEVSYE